MTRRLPPHRQLPDTPKSILHSAFHSGKLGTAAGDAFRAVGDTPVLAGFGPFWPFGPTFWETARLARADPCARPPGSLDHSPRTTLPSKSIPDAPKNIPEQHVSIGCTGLGPFCVCAAILRGLRERPGWPLLRSGSVRPIWENPTAGPDGPLLVRGVRNVTTDDTKAATPQTAP